MNYAIGCNMPGYLPESDVYVTSDYEAAKQALIQALEDMANWYDECDEHDKAEECSAMTQDINLLSAGEPWSGLVGSTVYWIDLTEEEPEEE